jgi:hypothetical protein
MTPWLFGLLIIAFGAISIFFPHFIFFINEGWKLRDAEPSDLYLTMTRIGGVIAIGVGLYVVKLPWHSV